MPPQFLIVTCRDICVEIWSRLFLIVTIIVLIVTIIVTSWPLSWLLLWLLLLWLLSFFFFKIMSQVRGLCLKSRELFLQQPILLELEAPLKICGRLTFLLESICACISICICTCISICIWARGASKGLWLVDVGMQVSKSLFDENISFHHQATSTGSTQTCWGSLSMEAFLPRPTTSSLATMSTGATFLYALFVYFARWEADHCLLMYWGAHD